MPADDFDRLVAPLQERMINCVWGIVRDGSETDDVMQEVLLQVWNRFDDVQRHPNPAALLLRYCTHRAFDHLRRRQTHSAVLGHPELPVASQPPTPVEQLAQDERREQIRAFLCQLPTREAEAIALHALEEMDYPEVAAAMDCRPSTVRVLIGRARQRFRDAFDRPLPVRGRSGAENTQPR
jgi:RNA polymerase sigma-70 factor (ECF subfamily)